MLNLEVIHTFYLKHDQIMNIYQLNVTGILMYKHFGMLPNIFNDMFMKNNKYNMRQHITYKMLLLID